VLWLLYALMAARVIRPDHPPVPQQTPLSRGRKWLGWLALVLFVLCFSPRPVRIARASEAASTAPSPASAPAPADRSVQAGRPFSFTDSFTNHPPTVPSE